MELTAIIELKPDNLTFCLICLASFLMVGFDLKNHAFPLWIWTISFLLLSFTSPYKSPIFFCILLAILTEFSSLKMALFKFNCFLNRLSSTQPLSISRKSWRTSLLCFKNQTKKDRNSFSTFSIYRIPLQHAHDDHIFYS